MNRNRVSVSMWIVALVALLAFPAWADRLPTTSPGPHAATVTGAMGEPGRDIYPVEFVMIDDTNISPRNALWLEPGKYKLTVRANARNPRGLQSVRGRIRQDEDLNRIEVVLEAGKIYHIGAHYQGRDRRAPYTTVLYRVEDRE